MSMVINLVEDHNIYLCEGGPVYNGGVQPTPITYLTQWKIVGNSEVHSLPYPDGVVLPTGYKRCEYLQFHGTEYIDTGIIPEQGISVYAKYTHTSFFGGDSGVFGCRERPWSRDSLYVFEQTSSAVYLISYGGKIADNNTASNPTIATGDNIELELDSTKCVIKVNGQAYNISNNNTITKGTKTIYLGKVNGYGALLIGKVYKFVLYGSNSLPIFNGIPCLDDNNVPCLYDTVSRTTLYNQGTGTFGYKLYPQPTEIWSCGEYNATDGKYHILVQPLGGSIADIALTEPLRKVNDVADTIEFPSETEGKAVLIRRVDAKKDISSTCIGLNNCRLFQDGSIRSSTRTGVFITDVNEGDVLKLENLSNYGANADALWVFYSVTSEELYIKPRPDEQVAEYTVAIGFVSSESHTDYSVDNLVVPAGAASIAMLALKTESPPTIIKYNELSPLDTPTTELVDAPQIEEADSYSCVISQGAKAVSWSDFLYYSGYLLTDSENNILVDSEDYQLTVQS